MTDFYKDLAEVLRKHKVAIIAKPNAFNDAVIGFQSPLCDNHWTGRNHLTGHDVKLEEEKPQCK
jgi:hypothetical protein